MKTYRIKIQVMIPCPREFEFNVQASNEAPAISRALKLFRKQIGRKQIKEWRIYAITA